jgi:hypothetical protein
MIIKRRHKPLPQETAALSLERLHHLFIYDEATGSLTWKARPESDFVSKKVCRMWGTRFAGKAVGSLCHGYLYVSIDYKNYAVHRIIFAMCKGYWPLGLIDHGDGDTLNNRICNLTDASYSDNAKNQKIRVNNSSGALGVCRASDGGKWVAYIRSGNIRYYLGRFDTKEDAIIVRRRAERIHCFHANHGIRT